MSEVPVFYEVDSHEPESDEALLVHPATLGRMAILCTNKEMFHAMICGQYQAEVDRWAADSLSAPPANLHYDICAAALDYYGVMDVAAYDTVHLKEALQQEAVFHTVKEAECHTMRASYLMDVRAELALFDGPQVTVIEDYLEQSTPPYLETIKPERLSWHDWLHQQASDEQLTNVLQWHMHSLVEQLTDSEADEEVQYQRLLFKRAVSSLIRTGLLSRRAEIAMQAIDQVDVQIGDVFDTFARHRGGYYVTGTQQVVVHQGSGRTAEEQMATLRHGIRSVLPHEFAHATLATTGRESDHPLGARWLDEALTETVALYVAELDGIGDHDIYMPERVLLDTLLKTYTSQPIALELATRAYSGDKTDYDYLVAALDAAWSADDVLGKVNAAVARRETSQRVSSEVALAADQEAALHSVTRQLQYDPAAIFLPHPIGRSSQKTTH